MHCFVDRCFDWLIGWLIDGLDRCEGIIHKKYFPSFYMVDIVTILSPRSRYILSHLRSSQQYRVRKQRIFSTPKLDPLDQHRFKKKSKINGLGKKVKITNWWQIRRNNAAQIVTATRIWTSGFVAATCVMLSPDNKSSSSLSFFFFLFLSFYVPYIFKKLYGYFKKKEKGFLKVLFCF